MKSNKAIIILIIILAIIVLNCACSNKVNQSSDNKHEEDIQRNLTTNPSIAPGSIPTTPKYQSVTTSPPIKLNKIASKPIILAAFSTKLLDKHKNRIINLKRASNKINNYTLKPNEIFSFNRIVGERSSSEGYKKAKILVSGESDIDIGGGICQLSSTIYNAARKLKLKIIERHIHSGDIHYLPMGYDAAVNYKDKDLKFKNTTKNYLQFRVKVTKNNLTVYLIKQSSIEKSNKKPKE